MITLEATTLQVYTSYTQFSNFFVGIPYTCILPRAQPWYTNHHLPASKIHESLTGLVNFTPCTIKSTNTVTSHVSAPHTALSALAPRQKPVRTLGRYCSILISKRPPGLMYWYATFTSAVSNASQRSCARPNTSRDTASPRLSSIADVCVGAIDPQPRRFTAKMTAKKMRPENLNCTINPLLLGNT